MMKRTALVLLSLILLLTLGCASNAEKHTTFTLESAEKNENASAEKTEEKTGAKPAEEQGSAAVAEEPEAGTNPVVTIVVKDYGTIVLELYPDVAPITVENFCTLAESGFYDGLTFHRVMKGFMIQGGDPNGNGSGGSGTNIKGEFAANGFENDLLHTRGVISMARATPYDSASSQFFIMHQDAPHLDGQYAAFGMVTSGMEVVDAICEKTPVIDSNGTVPAGLQPVIESITVER